jgi:hypothetical protein
MTKSQKQILINNVYNDEINNYYANNYSKQKYNLINDLISKFSQCNEKVQNYLSGSIDYAGCYIAVKNEIKGLWLINNYN